MLPLNSEDLSMLYPSPTTHLVPSSPFIVHRSGSPAPCVPDIDRLDRKKFTRKGNDLFGSSVLPSPLISSSQNSQLDSQPQRTPYTPKVTIECEQKNKSKSETPFLEQVVPCCSPFVMDDEKPSTLNNHAESSPHTEKQSQRKRQNRKLDLNNKSPEIEQLFQKDDIFA